MRESSKILITAAGGKVGQHVVTQLAEKKRISVRAGVHSQAKASALRKSGIEAAVLDFESPETIAAAFKGIDTLFLVSLVRQTRSATRRTSSVRPRGPIS
jgi:NAD(P)H dehydrogenase (quinone)